MNNKIIWIIVEKKFLIYSPWMKYEVDFPFVTAKSKNIYFSVKIFFPLMLFFWKKKKNLILQLCDILVPLGPENATKGSNPTTIAKSFSKWHRFSRFGQDHNILYFWKYTAKH